MILRERQDHQLLTRRVFSDLKEYRPKIDKPFAIEAEGLNGCPADRRQAEDVCEVVAPDEVSPPLLEPRVKQGHSRSRDRIQAFHLDVLVVVATLAGQGEILHRVLSASLERNDMLDGERLRRETLLTPAVFTVTPST
jgi:hypothetical protein